MQSQDRHFGAIQSIKGLSSRLALFQRHPPKTWRSNIIILVVLWVILLVASVTILASVVTPFLRTLQTQNIISLDWAGYAVKSNILIQQPIITMVNGSWTIPTVQVSQIDTFSAVWIGIGGESDSTLIQCGTEQDSLGGNAKYSVWYEMLPENSVTIKDFTVSPGDVFMATISLVSSSSENWQIDIADVTNGQRYSQVFAYNSSRLTAEWIVERPTVNNRLSNLANFDSVTFKDAHAQVGDTVGTIGDFANVQALMGNRQNTQLVTISPLSRDGSSFTATFVQSS